MIMRRGAKKGVGRGNGVPGGLRRNRNTEPCKSDGPGHGGGGGRGGGVNR